MKERTENSKEKCGPVEKCKGIRAEKTKYMTKKRLGFHKKSINHKNV